MGLCSLEGKVRCFVHRKFKKSVSRIFAQLMTFYEKKKIFCFLFVRQTCHNVLKVLKDL